jgi:hypothetical protein
MSEPETLTNIPVRSLAEHERVGFMPALFPGCYIFGENAVYGWADRFSREYSGGLWDFRTDDAGVRYLVPLGYDTFNVEQSMNGYEGQMSADAYGIFCTLMGLSQMMERHQDNEALFANFETLREFAYEHAEARVLIAALD